MNRERGFFLIELMVAMAVMGIVAVWVMQDAVRSSEETQAKRLGSYLAQYTNATRAYLADNAPAIAGFATALTQSGATWLKSTACTPAGSGTAAKPYLPCDYPATLPFGVTLTATLQAGVGGSAEIISGGSAITVDGATREDLAGVAFMAAQGESLTGPSVMNASIATSYAQGTGGTAGQLFATASNTPSTDVWLRVDGSNAMAGNLDMGTNSLTNVNAVGATGNITTTGGDLVAAAGGTGGNILADGDITLNSTAVIGKGNMALHEVVWVKSKNQLYLVNERQAFIPTDTWH